MPSLMLRVGLTAIALVGGVAGRAPGALIVLSNPVAPLPSSGGDGLVGDYYRPTGGYSAGSIANATGYIAANGTDATFVTTGINYAAGSTYGSGNSVGDGTTVGTYLGSDASSLAATAGSPSGETTAQVLANTLNGTIYDFVGYLAVTQAQVGVAQTFYLGSDDGSNLTIGGQQIIANDGDHGFGFSTGGNTVQFTQAGLYAINVLYYEDGGVTGVEFGSTLAGNGTYGGELTASYFYQTAPSAVPEPSSLALVGVASGFGLAALARRRGRSA